jgi:hypothetical protein
LKSRSVLPLAFSLAISFLLALSAAAAPPVISDADAAKHVGETVSVKGLVAAVVVARGDRTFINFGKPYPHQSFSALIQKGPRPRFKDPAKWKGKTITVTGTIQLSSKKTPQIVLEDPSQITE